MHKIEKKTYEMSTLFQEKTSLIQTLREKDLIIDELQKQVTGLKGDQAKIEMLKNETVNRCEEQMGDISFREHKKKSK